MMLNPNILSEIEEIEKRNSKLVLENRRLQNDVYYLQNEKQTIYNKLLKMKHFMEDAYDEIGRDHFSDKFYEE